MQPEDRARPPQDPSEAAEGSEALELSVVMPCLNEAVTLDTCIQKALQAMEQNGIRGEVIVADNGSTDGSQEIAERAGARVVNIDVKGYGSALLGGIEAARGTFVIMGDADDSYDFFHCPRFLEKLREGYDLVMGNRFLGGIKPGAMPPLHRYLGNPVLTAIGRLFFHSPSGDFHCGLRAFRKSSIERLDLRTTGMEFASEMVVKATLHRLRIAEVPTTLSPDGRDRAPHLRSWRDGWRHLRFMLLYSPRWLFFYPGLILMVLGLAVFLWLLSGPRTLGGLTFDIHTLLFAAAAILLGYQALIFSAFSRVYAVTAGLVPEPEGWRRLFRRFTLEKGILLGVLLVLAGLVVSAVAFARWSGESYGELRPTQTMRLAIPAVVCLTLGSQTILSSFFLSVMGLARR